MNLILEDDFRAIALQEGVREVCLADAWARFADRQYNGSVREFVKEAKSSTDPEILATHWFAAPVADSADSAALYSLAAQGELVKTHGAVFVTSLLAAEGLKLGQIKKAPKEDFSGTNNPYALPASDPKRAAKIVALVSSGNPKTASLTARLALAAGMRIDGTPLPKK
jgi:hypothetical protein